MLGGTLINGNHSGQGANTFGVRTIADAWKRVVASSGV